MIYLDNAATTLHKPPQVIEAVVEAMQTLGNAARGAHENSLQASRMIYDTRCALARLFGFSHPERVIFTANATESLNLALNGLFQPGDHVITTDLEHNSVLRPLYRLENRGIITLDFVPADRLGNPDYSAFENLIRPNTRAIVTTHASNLTGNLVDLPRVSAIAKFHGLLLVVDASQTAGSIPISMEELGIDLLCFTGHKGLMGPQGTGGLCVSPGITLRPWKVGGSGVHSYSRSQPEDYPTCLEAGTLNGHGIAGLSAAVDFLLETGVDAIARRERELTFRFYRGVKDIPGVTVYGDFSRPQRAAIVALNLGDEDSGQVADALMEDFGIAVRSGAHCAPRMHQALGTQNRGAVRFSFSWFTTEAEIDAAVAALAQLAEN